MRFLSLLHSAFTSQCAFGDGMRRLLVQQFFSLFAHFKITTKSHENYVFLYPFSNMAISAQNNEKNVFYTGKLYGLTGMLCSNYLHQCFRFYNSSLSLSVMLHLKHPSLIKKTPLKHIYNSHLPLWCLLSSAIFLVYCSLSYNSYNWYTVV